MKEPTEGDVQKMKRIVRYLIGMPEAKCVCSDVKQYRRASSCPPTATGLGAA